MHSTNLAVPTPADLKSSHIIQFSRRYQVLVRFSIESNARQEEDLQYLSTLVKPKALRCNKVFSFISFIVLPANSFSWALQVWKVSAVWRMPEFYFSQFSAPTKKRNCQILSSSNQLIFVVTNKLQDVLDKFSYRFQSVYQWLHERS